MGRVVELSQNLLSMILDVAPIILIIIENWMFVLHQKIPNLCRVVIGFCCVLIGLALFLEGLEQAVFPLGKVMAQQLSDPAFLLGEEVGRQLIWTDYLWV
ncbi:MAG: hypothetical protein ACI9W2_002045 [Gammaproteobacteria bacterium]|jgi:hypothetical protein